MRTVYETPTLQAKTSTGKDKFWKGIVLTDGENYYRSSEAWSTNNDGTESQHLISEPALIKGKNIGRRNEVIPEKQAILEVRAKMLQQKDKGYGEEGEEVKEFILPMLAHQWDKKSHMVRYPVIMQPKYDGTRMLYNSSIGHWSRLGKAYIPEVVAHLDFDTNGLTVDGELMLPKGYSFQDTIRAMKKYDKELTPNLIFHVYDIVDLKLSAMKRQTLLNELIRKWIEEYGERVGKAIELAPLMRADNEAEVKENHKKLVAEGYEGSIIRLLDSRYTPGQRSNGLLKLKDMQDAEFEIVGFSDGIGKDAGTVIFTCKQGEHTFNVRPMGSREERTKMFDEGDSYIGKMLTVRFQDYSEDGIPRFPVGISVREDY